MRRTMLVFAVAALAAVAGSALQAQRPEGDRGAPEADRGPREGGPREGGRFGGPGGGRFQLPIMQALDADGDGELSEKEIENAAVALKSLDKDKNGKVSAEELRPNFGNFGRPRGEARPDAEGRDAPREGRRPDAEDGAAARDGRRPAEAGAPADREGRGPGGGRGGFGPPNPEDFANRALEFDADKDGKLSKEELVKMGEQFGRGFGGGRPGAPPRPRDGEPRRPQRPE
jgi:EF hand domain-containing protein